MIKIHKSHKYCFHIYFDKKGGEEIIDALQSRLKDEEKILRVNYLDTRGKTLIDLVFLHNEITHNIISTRMRLSMEMDREIIEDAIERFEEAIEIKSFYPAEFYSGDIVKTAKTGRVYRVDINIYAFYKEEIEE